MRGIDQSWFSRCYDILFPYAVHMLHDFVRMFNHASVKEDSYIN